MIVFDNAAVSVVHVLTPTLFYHCDVSISGNSAEARYISSKVTLAEDSFISHADYMFYYNRVICDAPFNAVLVPINYQLIDSLGSVGSQLFFSNICFAVDRLDSGNALMFDRRYECLNDLFVPFGSMNSADWSTGIDLNENTSLDFVFFYDSPLLRSTFSFSTGTHVGVFTPNTPSKTLMNPSKIVRYISGLFPESEFLAQELIQIMGILDNYDSSELLALFPRNDLELRSFLRSLAVTMGRVSGNILMLKKTVEMLQEYDYGTASYYSPDSCLMDLNKHFTFRIGTSLFNYNPATLKLNFSSEFLNIPYYYTDDTHLLNVVRMIDYPEMTLVAEKAYLIYLDLTDSTIKMVAVPSDVVYDSIKAALVLLETVHIIPYLGIKVGATGVIESLLFFQTALVGAVGSSVLKYNSLIRSYATKSRSANLFMNIEKTDTSLMLFREIMNKAFAKDTRVFALLSDLDNDGVYIDELS
jgi:hypothetical protein